MPVPSAQYREVAAPRSPVQDRSLCFVAVGASGGEGLHDLRDLLEALPPDFPAVVLVVLHRPSDRVSHLREVLQRRSRLPVVIPNEADEFRPGTCYIGEPASHLSLATRSRVHLFEGGNYRNRTVDLLFASVAEHAGVRGIGVVLRGSLGDGSRGLAAIHLAGGLTMVVGADGEAAQGMPRNATDYDGPIDFIGSAREIDGAIVRHVCTSASRRPVIPVG
jgi:two-component system chemotaxis response regulator CheB